MILAWFAIGAALLTFPFAACSAAAASEWPAQLAASDAAGQPASEEPAQPSGAKSALLSPFWTKYAYFVPSQFGDLPGWREDHLAEAWKAFRSSCNVLVTRNAWSGTCARSLRVNTRDDEDIRRFFEQEFTLYQIENKDRSPAGVITGYYEPLLRGSRRYGGPYVYPVYGVPEDLLYLDSRSISQAFFGGPLFARVDGHAVIPTCDSLGRTACEGPYMLDVGDAKPDIRDKKLRVRIDGQRIVPYYTRAQIEQGVLASAHVIAWVDDRAALYAMQVQGSGRIQLPNGEMLRVAYAEQNGRPFNPPVQTARRASSTVLTRGIDIPVTDADEDLSATEPASVGASGSPLPHAEVATAGHERNTDSPGGAAADEDLSPEVARMVELLLKGNSSPQRVTQGMSTDSTKDQRPSKRPRPAVAGPAAGTAVEASIAETPSPFSNDPSYVFFRQIPDSAGGPPGALGVPLTPGRSVAVDPRTTPLGFPVFISTEGRSLGTRLNRLMLAQDTGGAIRGPVRADYFWGFGPSAGGLASRMNETGRMWLLLPRDLQITAGTTGFATRGVNGGAAGEAECLVPDPELCVE